MFTNDTPIFTFRGPFGVPVEIGASIFLLAFIFIQPQNGIQLDNIIYFLLILLAIFLHEFGHAWGTLVQGHSVKRVMIYGGGGFCEGYRVLPRAEEEFVVAMGPIVNLALWAIFGLAYPFVIESSFYWLGKYVYWFYSINFFLFCLNMIPVQPLDGGKLFFLTMMRFFDRDRAIKIAGFVGLVCAVLWIPAMIACFVLLGFLLIFMPSIRTHWQMFRGTLG
ncbi:site-2 protease family protein [Amylibacter sp. IMCC11727]|uniref:site-2 protease family protein n=1 Tax=Amylibacter sp. IMCC11727 TaxID=3039851 RepID=UPI00244E03A6|nr:site-2 protease family protein [Amylibacter sp. IMCC11727]WGI22967.1 site-2 protease family protein [Amylibacter sp. IMCC11727]